MIEALLNDESFEITRSNGDWTIDGDTVSPSVYRIDSQSFHLLHEGKGYRVLVLGRDKSAGTVDLRVNGKHVRVELRSRMQRLLEEMGLEDALTQRIEVIHAPMPGLIHSILVAPGDEVNEGDPLLILEAMKMENVIKSPGDGQVSEVSVKEKASVEKGAVLIRFV